VWTVAALAAGIVMIVATRIRSTDDSYPPTRFARGLSPSAITAQGPVWGATRGSPNNLAPAPRGVRLGALLTDLQVDIGRSELARAHARATSDLLDGVIGGGTLGAAIVAAVADSARSADDKMAALGEQALALVDLRSATVGAYLEAARLACAAGDTGFFDRHPSDPIADLARDQSVGASTIALLAAYDTLTKKMPRSAPTLLARTTDLLLTLTR
jgi:hypothetical protein